MRHGQDRLAKSLLWEQGVELTGLMNAAFELFDGGHYPGVVAVCTDALGEAPDQNELRLLLARALVALRQDRQAHKQLGEVLRRDSSCAPAYRLIGELALRNDDLLSAEVYFREAVRLNPGDSEARDWLDVVFGLKQSASRAVPCFVRAPSSPRPTRPGLWRASTKQRFAQGTAPVMKVDPDRLPARGYRGRKP